MPRKEQPLAPALAAQVREAVNDAVERIADFAGVRLPAVQLDFGLRGHCAGQARVAGRELQVRVNLELLHRYQADYLAQTIPHEVAHLYVLWRHRFKRRKPRPHGPEWQVVMQDCFGLEPQRCHSYETRPARSVPRAFLYACSCREHRLTSIMHNRIKTARQALCRYCRAPLRFVGKQALEQK